MKGTKIRVWDQTKGGCCCQSRSLSRIETQDIKTHTDDSNREMIRPIRKVHVKERKSLKKVSTFRLLSPSHLSLSISLQSLTGYTFWALSFYLFLGVPMAQKDFIFKKLFSSPLGPQEIGREINVGPKDILKRRDKYWWFLMPRFPIK